MNFTEEEKVAILSVASGIMYVDDKSQMTERSSYNQLRLSSSESDVFGRWRQAALTTKNKRKTILSTTSSIFSTKRHKKHDDI